MGWDMALPIAAAIGTALRCPQKMKSGRLISASLIARVDHKRRFCEGGNCTTPEGRQSDVDPKRGRAVIAETLADVESAVRKSRLY